MIVYWVTGILLILYLVLVWFLGSWFHLKAPDLWILRGGLALIGIVAAASFLWFYRKAKAARGGDYPQAAPGGTGDDIDLLAHEAMAALRKSTLGRGATLRNLPLLFFVGDSGSAKTNIIVHSRLDPELLAGQVYQDNNVVPTRLANIWYSQHAILVDPAGSLLQQPERWKRLVQLVRPGRALSALSKSQQAPRAAVLCFDCANFLRAGASEATLSTARGLGTRLHEISQTLSISLPVYVLFTKLDRLQGFTEFARALTPDEASQILGVTLPMRSLSSGVYSEEETKRLTNAFDELFFSLADRRLELLARENDSDSLPSIYEFPRELRKLRTLLVQFLVEMAKPSLLSVNPFLRGFYFSGVRPVFLEDGVSAAPQASAPDAHFDGGATQVFGSLPVRQAAAPVRPTGRRKVPQWTFLTRLFNDVIVKDRVALAASGVSSSVSLIRRVALIAVAALSFVAMVGFLVSYLGNHELESNVRAAAATVTEVHLGAHQLPAVGDLQKLDKLRQELQTLAAYDTQGVPLRLRWFLYVGDKIRPDAKRVYFNAFRQMLFDDAQGIILNDLHQLPDQPGPDAPNDAYETTYDELKAHLITAQYYDKSTNENPGKVMADRWATVRHVDPQLAAIAERQFEYYSSELKSGDPLGTKEDNVAIQHARSYLANFGGIERFYRPLINQASEAAPPADFAAKFPNAANVVYSKYVVKGAYTPRGYKFMTDAIRDPARFLAAEEWVLGKTTASDMDPATLQQKLLQRYETDYIDEWQKVLKEASVSVFLLKDADQKLDRLTAPDSPLLELLWFVSSNTNVDHVKDVFASVQNAAAPGVPDKLPEQLKQPSNDGYIQSLTALRNNIDVLTSSPTGSTDANLVNQVNSAAAAARTAATQLAGSRLDNTYHTPQTLQAFLEEPIVYAERAVGNVAPDKLNAAGQAMCAQFSRLASKFPLNQKAGPSQEMTPDEFNGFFAPKTGALWTFYDTNQLSQYLLKEGNRYSATQAGTVKITPSFVAFFNRMATVTDVFYPSGSPTPHFIYSLIEQQSNVPGQLILSIDKEVLSGAGQQKKFTWTGVPEDIRVTAGVQTLRTYSGLWAAFRFVYTGSEVSHSHTNLRWDLLQSDGSAITINGKPEFYSYQLQTDGPDPFEVVNAAGTRCEAHVAH
jgi:type VI secretion system protein ImpL